MIVTTTTQNKPPALWRWFLKVQNPFMKWLLRSPLHGLVSRMYLLITFTGRKSGGTYTTPVQYAQDGDMLYIITSEGYTWWRNLRGGADVRIHLRGQTYPARADISTDPKMIQALVTKLYPGLSAERVALFAPGKVAIIVTTQKTEVKG
jgi:deazaflavin-dependent oxidoreductase (nitroreductase family)